MPALVKICMLLTLSLDLCTNLVSVVYMYVHASRLYNEISNNPVMLLLKFFKLLYVRGCIS